MQQVASFDIGLVGGSTAENVRKSGEKLASRVVAAWNGLRDLVANPDARLSGVKPPPLSGYYGSAYESANAGVPVATFRGLI